MIRSTLPIVGLMGKKRSGKDTFAAALVEHRGFVRYAFADPLKDALLHANPLVRGSLRVADLVGHIGWEGAKEVPEVRRLLQEYGMSIRAIEPEFWINATMRPAARELRPVVVTDVRFPNEADAVHKAGGILVRITRKGLVSDDPHASETALDGYPADLDVLNAGTVETLQETARALLF